MIGPVLRELVKRKLMSANRMSQITGYNKTAVYRWLRGENEPRFDVVQRIYRGCTSSEGKRLIMEAFTGLPTTAWSDSELKEDICNAAYRHVFGGEDGSRLYLALTALRTRREVEKCGTTTQ